MFRLLLILALFLSSWTLAGCPTEGGDDDDSSATDDDDATGDDDDATGDDDDATGDDDDSAGDDDDSAGDDDDATGDDDDSAFAANGPASGTYWEFVPPGRSWPVDECNYGGIFTFSFQGEGMTITNVNASDQSFMLMLNGATMGTSNTFCDYELDGTWTCTPWAQQQDLSALPQNAVDAVIDFELNVSGQYGPISGTAANAPQHTYSMSYSSSLLVEFEMSCSGTQCAAAQAMSGVTGWPCTTQLAVDTANLDDPGLPPLSCW